MSSLINLTPFAAGQWIGRTPAGPWSVAVSVKASFTWDTAGRLSPAPTVPLVVNDGFDGEGEPTVLVTGAELGPAKPEVDVLVTGLLTFARPITRTEVGLRVGESIRKVLHVFGERRWTIDALGRVQPGRPDAVTSVPIDWRRSFGGTDKRLPGELEPRNPAGVGLASDPVDLVGQQLPNFEDATSSAEPGKPSVPAGFGPLAPHWQPRRGSAGTYDAEWQEQRAPLAPRDFCDRFFNVAPEDQRLRAYLPGAPVELTNMTPAGVDRFELPPLHAPVTVATTDDLVEEIAAVDTIHIEPALRRVSLVARATAVLSTNPLSLRHVVVGPVTSGLRRALVAGKAHRVLIRTAA